jgi:hypothetical protein
MTGPAGLLTPGATDAAALPGSPQKAHSARSLALTAKESLLEFSHFGFQHVHLGLQFLGPGHRAPMLTPMIMGLLTQGDHFGSQELILRLERGMFLPERPCLLPARLRGGPHAWGSSIAACPRTCPAEKGLKPFFSADAFTEYVPFCKFNLLNTRSLQQRDAALLPNS